MLPLVAPATGPSPGHDQGDAAGERSSTFALVSWGVEVGLAVASLAYLIHVLSREPEVRAALARARAWGRARRVGFARRRIDTVVSEAELVVRGEL
jgi:hypothetical protein